jgi:hypothetical protein
VLCRNALLARVALLGDGKGKASINPRELPRLGVPPSIGAIRVTRGLRVVRGSAQGEYQDPSPLPLEKYMEHKHTQTHTCKMTKQIDLTFDICMLCRLQLLRERSAEKSKVLKQHKQVLGDLWAD